MKDCELFQRQQLHTGLCYCVTTPHTMNPTTDAISDIYRKGLGMGSAEQLQAYTAEQIFCGSSMGVLQLKQRVYIHFTT